MPLKMTNIMREMDLEYGGKIVELNVEITQIYTEELTIE